MKIERISDNQIRCTLSSFDLSVRNLNLGELAYGGDKARNLFREMIQKASNEVGFEAEDMPLMVEAVPLSNESVMLIISIVDDPEEIDTRFAKFAPMADGQNNQMAYMNPGFIETLEGAEGVPVVAPDIKTNNNSLIRIYRFDSLDSVIDAAHAVNPSFNDQNRLYKNPQDNMYYLVIEGNSENQAAHAAACNVLLEYGTRVPQTYGSSSLYDEHYEVIIKNNALQALAKIN